MDARILDTRVGTECYIYPDWSWLPANELSPDRFGHVRAQKCVDGMNKREGTDRFQVVRVSVQVGARVMIRAYNRIRTGTVTALRVSKNCVSVRVYWYNKKGEIREHWYTPANLRNAGTPVGAFSRIATEMEASTKTASL